MTWRRFGITYLAVQGLGAALWWLMLLALPATRCAFLPPHAPDVTLLSFAVADGTLFIGTSLLAAFGLWRHRSWTRSVLMIHAGAAGYAGLYCWTLFVFSDGHAWLGALLMTPSLVVPGVLAWRIASRPGGSC